MTPTPRFKVMPPRSSPRPSHAIHPSAKLTSDNAGAQELSSHRRAVASANSVAQPRPEAPASLSTATLPDLNRTDSLTLSDLAPARTSCKRPQASQDGTSSAPTLIDGHNGNSLISKKAKKNRPTTTDLDTSEMDSEVQIMDIDDVHDPREEPLSKTDPTADIRAFLTALPRVPGEPKPHMSCNLYA